MTGNPDRRASSEPHRDEILVSLVVGSTAHAQAVATSRPHRRRIDTSRAVIPVAGAALTLSSSPAWPEPSANLAARRRRADRDRRCLSLVSVSTTPSAPDGSATAVIEALVELLAARGGRRLDVLIDVDDDLAGLFPSPLWYRGRVGSNWLVGRAIETTDPRPPESVSRMRRRLRSLQGGQLGDRVANLAEEAVRRIGGASAAERRQDPTSVPELPIGSFDHQRTRFRIARRALSLVPPAHRRTAALLDVGCGDGRVLGLAHDLGFTNTTGVEVDPTLVDRARRATVHSQVIEGDATGLPVADEVGTVYLFNPFDDRSTRAFAEQVAASLSRRPRPLVVLYVNARARRAFTDIGLSIVHNDQHLTVLHNP